MEPFIIEEFIVFLVLVAGGGFVVFLLVKSGLNSWVAYRAAHECPRAKLTRIISDSESKLAGLQRKIEDLKRHHARLQSNSRTSSLDSEHWQKIEEESHPTVERYEEYRAVIKRRLEAEQHEKIARLAEDESRKAIADVERRHHELDRKIVFAKAALAALEARLTAAEIKKDVHDDFGNGTDAAIEQLENAVVDCESRAESFEETSRYFNKFAARISDDDVTAEIERAMNSEKEKHS